VAAARISFALGRVTVAHDRFAERQKQRAELPSRELERAERVRPDEIERERSQHGVARRVAIAGRGAKRVDPRPAS
jgi:hypothetical protein